MNTRPSSWIGRVERVMLAVATALLLASTGCEHHHENKAAPAASPVENVLDTVTVHARPVSSQLVLNARLMANPTRVVQVFPPAGGLIRSLNVLPGDTVREGQQIGTIQSDSAAQARANYAKAQIEVARSDVQLARAQDLLNHQVMSVDSFDNIKALNAADHAELNHARQALAILGLEPGSTSDVIAIHAPISGVVLNVNAARGEYEGPGSGTGAIATVAAINPIWVVGDLYSNDVSSVSIGQPVTVSVAGYSNMTINGVISNISDTVDPTALTLKARVVVPNPGYKLKPGMYATITVTNTEETAFAVPSTAVVRNGDEPAYVFLMNSKNKPVRRNVTLGGSSSGNVIVLKGLKDGDRIVTTGVELLRESEDQ